MSISGFSFARDAIRLGYPLREALLSVLPITDELVVAVARGEPDDGTRALVEALDDPRVRILDVAWDDRRRQLAYSDITNAALDACSGDWCLYVQADEVLHEDDLGRLRARTEGLTEDPRVEGLLFDYLHFFGDYRHVQRGQGWYAREIRLVRNRPDIRSVRDAQSFRGPGGRRLTVADSGARIFHYGWVRHPRVMQIKTREFWSHRLSRAEVDALVGAEAELDYGPMSRLDTWEGAHPAVMTDRIASMDWAHMLRDCDPPGVRRRRHRDERVVRRLLTSVSRVTGLDLNHTNHGKVLRV